MKKKCSASVILDLSNLICSLLQSVSHVYHQPGISGTQYIRKLFKKRKYYDKRIRGRSEPD